MSVDVIIYSISDEVCNYGISHAGFPALLEKDILEDIIALLTLHPTANMVIVFNTSTIDVTQAWESKLQEACPDATFTERIEFEFLDINMQLQDAKANERLFLQLHHFATTELEKKIEFHAVLRDERSIASLCYFYFKQNPYLIPDNITLKLRHYLRGKFTHGGDMLSVLQGIGTTHTDFKNDLALLENPTQLWITRTSLSVQLQQLLKLLDENRRLELLAMLVKQHIFSAIIKTACTLPDAERKNVLGYLMFVAIIQNNKKALEKIIKHDTNFCITYNRNTPLQLASQHKQWELVVCFLKNTKPIQDETGCVIALLNAIEDEQYSLAAQIALSMPPALKLRAAAYGDNAIQLSIRKKQYALVVTLMRDQKKAAFSVFSAYEVTDICAVMEAAIHAQQSTQIIYLCDYLHNNLPATQFRTFFTALMEKFDISVARQLIEATPFTDAQKKCLQVLSGFYYDSVCAVSSLTKSSFHKMISTIMTQSDTAELQRFYLMNRILLTDYFTQEAFSELIAIVDNMLQKSQRHHLEFDMTLAHILQRILFSKKDFSPQGDTIQIQNKNTDQTELLRQSLLKKIGGHCKEQNNPACKTAFDFLFHAVSKMNLHDPQKTKEVIRCWKNAPNDFENHNTNSAVLHEADTENYATCFFCSKSNKEFIIELEKQISDFYKHNPAMPPTQNPLLS